MIGPELEEPRPATGDGFGDAVTYAFGDPTARLYGSVRLGLVAGTPPHASSIALLFSRTNIAAVSSSGAVELDALQWTAVEAGDVTATVVEPLKSWTVSFDGDGGGFELRFDAVTPPAEIGQPAIAKSAAALHGYEQLCKVSGTVTVNGQRRTVDCLGQRGHQWGSPDWQRIERSRTLGVWLDSGQGVALASVRPRGTDGHDGEIISAFLLDGDVAAIADPRLSTTVDGNGRQLRAGLELWVDGDDEAPLHAAGEALCGTTFDLGELRLDCTFFQWRIDGQRGVGRYDVLQRR